jgi:hypothetical protein
VGKKEKKSKLIRWKAQGRRRGGGSGQELTFLPSFHHSFQATRNKYKLATRGLRRRRLARPQSFSDSPPQLRVQFSEVPRRVPALAASQVKRK